MRWAQLTLVENDPGQFDPQFWLDYFQRLHADAACLSAGGIVAYYPTEVPLHHRSEWLGESRSVRRARGRMPRARHARHRAHGSACRTRRCARRASRLDRGYERPATPCGIGPPELWVTCALGPYNFEFMNQVHREIVSLYQVDGIFANRWALQGGDCYCEHCQQNYATRPARSFRARPIPRDPLRAAIPQWQKARLFELWRELWDTTSARAIPRHVSFRMGRQTARRPSANWRRFSSPTTRPGED